MNEYILKDWYNKPKIFTDETIYAQGKNGELIPFTKGAKAVIEPLNVTENGTYEVPAGVDGFAPVTVSVDPGWTTLFQQQQVEGFVFDSEFNAYTSGNLVPAPFVLEAGKTYRVKWDEEVRECTAYAFTNYYNFVAIGNGKNLGFEDTGEKFLILHNTTVDSCHLFSQEALQSHTVGIWEETIPKETQEMIYYRSLAEALMVRRADYFSNDRKKMIMKGFVMSDGGTLASLNSYSFAGFTNVEGMSFSGVGLVYKNALTGCTSLKVLDITTNQIFGILEGALNNCPNIESIIIRDGGKELTTASVLKTAGGNDTFYVYVPSAYYDAVMASWTENMIAKERYRKLEDYPSVDHWYESYFIKYYDSDGTTLLRTQELVYGTVPSYIPTKSGYDFAGWTPEPAMVTGEASYIANWVEKVTFASATWEQISAITTEGTSAAKFTVGDTRTEMLTYSDGSTENVEFAIAKIRSDGSMVLVPTHALAAQKPMHTSISQSSPSVYGNSFGEHLTGTVFPALPEDFRAVIRKATYMFAKRDIRPLSADNLYVNGEKENSDSFYESLPLFSTAAKRIRKINGTPVTYWTGTYATVNNYYYFGYVDASGTYKDPKLLGGADGVTANRGVVFAVDV